MGALAGGTGFIGHTLVEYYLNKNYSITIISRSIAQVKKNYSDQVQALSWSGCTEENMARFKNADLIINLCGAGIADQRWTNARRQEIIESRLIPTQKLVAICASLGPASPPLFNASAIGIYGHQSSYHANTLPPAVNEQTTIAQDTSLFSVQVTKQWEAACQPAIDAGVRVVFLRFGIVIGKAGGIIAKLRPVYQLGLGGKIGHGKQVMSWVSCKDIAKAIDFLQHNPSITGPVNLVAPHSVTQQQFATELGKHVHRPTFITTPGYTMKWLYGVMAEELLLRGQHVAPMVLSEAGFKFEDSTLDSALSNL